MVLAGWPEEIECLPERGQRGRWRAQQDASVDDQPARPVSLAAQIELERPAQRTCSAA